MLNIHLVVIGEKVPAWVHQGYQEYAKRIHGRCALKLMEVAAERRGKNLDLNKIAELEARQGQSGGVRRYNQGTGRITP